MPLNFSSSASACFWVSGVIRYGRAEVIASNESATCRMRASLRDLVADQSVGISGAVEPFVVMANDRQLGLELLDRADDLLALDRVGVHDHALVAGERALLEQDGVGDADLADVVEQAAPLESLELRLGAAQLLAQVLADQLDTLRVAGGERILGVHRARQARTVCVNISRISTIFL